MITPRRGLQVSIITVVLSIVTAGFATAAEQPAPAAGLAAATRPSPVEPDGTRPDGTGRPGTGRPGTGTDGTGADGTGPVADEAAGPARFVPRPPGPGSQLPDCEVKLGDQPPQTNPSFQLSVDQDRAYGYRATANLDSIRTAPCGRPRSVTVDWGDGVRDTVDLQIKVTQWSRPHRYGVRNEVINYIVRVTVTDDQGRTAAQSRQISTAPVYDVTVGPIEFKALNDCDSFPFSGKGDFIFTGFGHHRTRFDLDAYETKTLAANGYRIERVGRWEPNRVATYAWDELDTGLLDAPLQGFELVIGGRLPGSDTVSRTDRLRQFCSAQLTFHISTALRAD
jgi:hypothetical protein